MKRREILKAALVLACSSAGFLSSGCKNQSIIPKKTGVFEFSTPLPFNFNLIDEITQFNKTLKKSKVTTFYNSLPLPLASGLSDFQTNRGQNYNIKTKNDFLKYVKYAQNKGFEFIYTLNSPKNISNAEFDKNSKQLCELLDFLGQNNVLKIKAATNKLFDFISLKYPEFSLGASTSFEFHTLKQYENLLEKYPKIKAVNLTLDENKNFELLKSLKQKFPKIKFELMANEACLFGCPARISHPCSMVNECEYLDIILKKGFSFIATSRVIFPWDLDYYSAIGINNFKLMKGSRANLEKITFLKFYLNIAEKGFEKITAKEFFEEIYKTKSPKIKNDKILLSDIFKYLPDINYFVKNGKNCANVCESRCFYCFECAKKLEKILC